MIRKLMKGHRAYSNPAPFVRPPVNRSYRRPMPMTMTAQEWADDAFDWEPGE